MADWTKKDFVPKDADAYESSVLELFHTYASAGTTGRIAPLDSFGASPNLIGQTFRVPFRHHPRVLDKISVMLSVVGDQFGNVQIGLYRAVGDIGFDSTAVYDGTGALVISDPVPLSSITSGGVFTESEFNFSSDLVLIPGEDYVFVLKLDDAASIRIGGTRTDDAPLFPDFVLGNYVQGFVHNDDFFDPDWIRDNSGSPNPASVIDLFFKLYSRPKVPSDFIIQSNWSEDGLNVESSFITSQTVIVGEDHADPNTNDYLRTYVDGVFDFELSAPTTSVTGIYWGGEYLWVLSKQQHEIYKTNPNSGSIIDEYSFVGNADLYNSVLGGAFIGLHVDVVNEIFYAANFVNQKAVKCQAGFSTDTDEVLDLSSVVPTVTGVAVDSDGNLILCNYRSPMKVVKFVGFSSTVQQTLDLDFLGTHVADALYGVSINSAGDLFVLIQRYPDPTDVIIQFEGFSSSVKFASDILSVYPRVPQGLAVLDPVEVEVVEAEIETDWTNKPTLPDTDWGRFAGFDDEWLRERTRLIDRARITKVFRNVLFEAQDLIEISEEVLFSNLTPLSEDLELLDTAEVVIQDRFVPFEVEEALALLDTAVRFIDSRNVLFAGREFLALSEDIELSKSIFLSEDLSLLDTATVVVESRNRFFSGRDFIRLGSEEMTLERRVRVILSKLLSLVDRGSRVIEDRAITKSGRDFISISELLSIVYPLPEIDSASINATDDTDASLETIRCRFTTGQLCESVRIDRNVNSGGFVFHQNLNTDPSQSYFSSFYGGSSGDFVLFRVVPFDGDGQTGIQGNSVTTNLGQIPFPGGGGGGGGI
jgi:hypothetical protein